MSDHEKRKPEIPDFQNPDEIVRWIRDHQKIVDLFFQTPSVQCSDDHRSAPALEDDAKWSARKTIDIIKHYFCRNPESSTVKILSGTNGVPDIFDVSDDSTGFIVFSNGYRNGFIDSDGSKPDIEMETRFAEAAADHDAEHYVELLMQYIEQFLFEEPALLFHKQDAILYAHRKE